MNIEIKWFNDQFNVELSSKPGAEAFLTVKGARIVQGSNGPFISWPATKNQNTGKFWNHVWASDKFAAAVLEKAQATQPQQSPRRRQKDDEDSDIPF